MSLSRDEREEFERDMKESNVGQRYSVGVIDKVKKKNKYQRKCKGVYIDVYDVLKSFEVNNPAVQHATKKLLASGKRGYKGTVQDLKEAIASIERAIELETEDE